MINIQNDALIIITESLKRNPGKYPRIILRSGGCAGHMLVLTLDTIQSGDIEYSEHGLTFAIEPVAEPYIDNITIYKKPGLTSEILIHNNSPEFTKCRCGKSFKIK